MRYVVAISILILAGAASFFICDVFVAKETPPKFDRVFDSAMLFSNGERDSINDLMKKLEDELGTQVAVIAIDSLPGMTIEQYSLRESQRMQFGRKDFDDGVLITIALRDRATRIEVGAGLENILKDEIATRYLTKVMIPYFIENKFGTGVYTGIDSIAHLLRKHKHRIGERPK
jgi:uncharacterized protein